MEDTYRHKGLRKKLVDELREKGISDQQVLDAIGNIPRHFFLDNAFLEFAYQDKAFPIAAGQTISQPYTVAFQTQLLEVRRGEKILEVGTGSGYQAAVLCELKAKVFSVERQKALYDFSRRVLRKMGYRPKLFFGDGYEGAPAFGPFDKIIVTCGAPSIPSSLLEQLKEGGRLVVPVGEGKTQMMTEVLKQNGEYVIKEFGEFSFVPMLMKKNKES